MLAFANDICQYLLVFADIGLCYLSPGLTHPDGGVDPMVISMTLSKEDFSLRDGALDPMDICMTLLKGVEIARFFDNFLSIVTAIANIHCKRFDASRWGGGSDGHLYDFAKRCKVLIQQFHPYI